MAANIRFTELQIKKEKHQKLHTTLHDLMTSQLLLVDFPFFFDLLLAFAISAVCENDFLLC